MPGSHSIEWPTWLLIAVVYATWLLVVWSFRVLGPLSAVPLAIVACWFMSLQHELLHGHPTRSPVANRLLALAPLAVWYPYDLYREAHFAHHRDESLTQPGLDPESNYIAAADYERLSLWLRPMWIAQRTVIGRLLLGPAMVIVPTWLDIVRKPWRGDFTQTRMWAQHPLLLAVLLWALERHAGIGPLQYMLAVGYPALGLAMLRSFYEHRPASQPAHRVVVNEAGWFWRLLYLNNNYHVVHHEMPQLPWYRIPTLYLADRPGVLQRNGGFLIHGYASPLRRHAFSPVDSPVHPPTYP
ncbi:MAG: fatty acid desaturase [Burkholderiales bacterium]|jgi:fatty acid desaturase|nr:fatty acid desaturase [Burkholderiales bacterium]